jgi:THAP4-like, heme-binding beta-barrel domain
MADEHPFAALAATWRGTGQGEYPTIASFEYTEEFVITPVPGRPVAHWRSATRDAATREPRHGESGYLRNTPQGIELVVAHSFGVVEATAGSFDGAVLALGTTGLLGTASAKRIDEVARRYELDGETMRYTIAMSAVGVPLTHHLRAELQRA